MKPFNELTPEEQLDIVRFSTSKGTYYYSKIDYVSATEIVYNGLIFTVPQESYEKIKEGLDRYEIYKLSMTTSEAEGIIKDNADEILDQYYSSKLDAIISQFEKFTRKAESTIKSATSKISINEEAVSDTLTHIKDIQNKLSVSSEVLDMSNITKQFKEKMNDVKSVKDEFTENLKPVKQDLDSLISSLRQIVKIEK